MEWCSCFGLGVKINEKHCVRFVSTGWREAQRLELTGAEDRNFITDTERHQRLAAILQAKPKLLEHPV